MAPSERQRGALNAPLAASVAGVAGLACMSLELTAVRLLAPYFGDSAYVWTNVIGVILLALALGAWTGGRLAERPGGSPLRAMLLMAAAMVAIAPLLAPALGAWLLPQELPLDAAMPALVRGSFVATVLLFAPPIWLLGALTPGLVVGCVRGGVPTGRAAGLVGAAGTIGSLVGTFAATHWLVPGLGCRVTLWLSAGVLALAAMLLRRSPAAMAVTVLVLGSVLLQRGPLRAALPGQQLLAERESCYQYLRVLRVPGDGERATRIELKINEGLDSYHSVAIEGSALTSDASSAQPPSSYYDYHALVPFLVGAGTRPDPLHVLSVGDAAGTFRRVYAGVHPNAVVDGVELDATAVALGDEYFPGARAPGKVFTGIDGRVFVDRARQRWHVMHIDAYSHQVYIPGHLASREFFTAVREHLEPGGAVACNVGGLEARDPVLQAIARTMAAVFGSAAALHIPNSRNFLVVARRDATVDADVLTRLTFGGEQLSPRDLETWRRVVAEATRSTWVTFAPASDDAVLVDDRPELDELLDQSYVQGRDDGIPIALAGNTSPAAAEATAYAAFASGDMRATLAAAAASRAATPYLRYLCGSSRWTLRQLRGAAAEYEAGLSLDPPTDLRAGLQQQLQSLRQDLDAVELAEATSRRNGWLGLGAAAALLGATLALAYRMSRIPAAPSVNVSTAAR